MSGHAHGGNDTFIASGAYLLNKVYGDASYMYDDAKGGNDTLKVTDSGDNSNEVVYGDALQMRDNAVGGNDTLTVNISGSSHISLFGDADAMYGNTQGGNDTLTGERLQLHCRYPLRGCLESDWSCSLRE